ncbi:succinylglutamate desuccinylase/aspartoacylase family protein [Deferribacteraceae bacterium V6Fe1]|nr:succinylglutamate desuccinylase/aspartoacylase family protein [Deferribacteraceae bacterium V6Fe1]
MKIAYFLILSLALSFNLFGEVNRPFKEHKVYFEGTDYELNVYKIYGRKDGNTMLIMGGIQGDEPGGFLSADLYSDLSLEKGNLIVIPRANFKSIILFKRSTEADMNRRFHLDDVQIEMDKVVQVIKQLMSEADVFLNLHDGWGFHTPTHINWLRSPERFGQSVIVDTGKFTCDNGTVIDLEGIAKKALEEINEKIGVEDYYMQYFNTNTDDPKTPYLEMRKTATYFALKTLCLPSFGIETSKNLPSDEMKILHHNYAVNAFMKIYDIIPEQPQIILTNPEINFVIIKVNGEPKIVSNNSTLVLKKGSVVQVAHIDSNYKRGLSCDIEGVNGLNDKNIPFKITENKTIVFRKDSIEIGKINLKIDGKIEDEHGVFIVKVNNQKKAVLQNDTLVVKKGDTLNIIKFFSENINSDPKINFKGWVPSGINYNDGDDRGYDILIDGNFMAKYSKYGNGSIFPVIAGDSNNILGQFYVKIIE